MCTTIELSRLLEELDETLRAEIAGLATLTSTLTPGLPPVDGDAEKMRELLVMLVKNAAHSLRQRPGVVHVESGITHHDGSPLRNAFGATPRCGPYVYVEISDPGIAVAAPAEPDPMNETISSTRKRGLGFAAALGVVRRHGGVITTGRTPSGGSRLRVMMPTREALPVSAR
ncbi:MAG: hypothetical protein H6713_07255 [Myxococcales bacterium]|nr:hypothetical protein [Myxococcales bacterium]